MELLGSEGALETEKVRLTADVEQQGRLLEAFRVHEDYKSIETEANRLTEELHQLANANFGDRQAIGLYTATVQDETAGGVTSDQIKEVYEEAGLHFPQAVAKTLDDVAAFHDAVVANRREYLAGEVERLEHRVNSRDQRVQELDATRAELMEVLRTHGALDEFLALQTLLNDARAQLAEVEMRIQQLREIADAKRSYRDGFENWNAALPFTTRSCGTSAIKRSGTSTRTRRHSTRLLGV